MKIYQFFILFFFLTVGTCFSQVTITNIQTATTITFNNVSTPNNPNSYVWSEVSNIKQGVKISVVPPERGEIYLQQSNSWINFNTYSYGLMTSLEVQYDGGNWQTIFSSASYESGWLTCPFSSLGHHSITVKWRNLASHVFYRDYDVYIVPQCQKLFKDNNYGNILNIMGWRKFK